MALKSRFPLIAGCVVVVVAGVAIYTLNHADADAAQQDTDDAYVQADMTEVAPQVAGVISQVKAEDNQAVHAGDLLVHIDDRPMRIALDNAKAHVTSAQAAVDSLQAQIERQQSSVEQAQATVSADEANLTLAQANRTRFTNLAKDGSGTQQAQQQAQAQWEVQHAAVERDRAGLRAAQQQVSILKADLEKAKAGLLSAKAEQSGAELNLSYTQITAPINGVVAARTARQGGYARVGQSLLTIVPLNAVYVEANFRETQLAHVKVGQPVSFTVDALPGVTLRGKVDSLGPASGVSFSPVAPHNATGNFTKIVQRLPVRIHIDPDQAEASQLRVGMSVHPRIDLHS